MSKLELATKWDRLENTFASIKEGNVEDAMKQYKAKELCIDGLASQIKGHKKLQFCFNDFLMELGFTKDETYENRMCVVGDCKYTGTIHALLNHMIGYHSVPIQNIARLIPYVRDDIRKLPSKLAQAGYRITHPQMITD